jgi:hypothetical protein
MSKAHRLGRLGSSARTLAYFSPQDMEQEIEVTGGQSHAFSYPPCYNCAGWGKALPQVNFCKQHQRAPAGVKCRMTRLRLKDYHGSRVYLIGLHIYLRFIGGRAPRNVLLTFLLAGQMQGCPRQQCQASPGWYQMFGCRGLL